MTSEDYLRQQLEWIKYRAKALEEIEAKLQEMRSLATYARDNHMSPEMAQEFNARLHVLQREIIALDEQTRVFWMDCQ
jgi:flagellin-like hook-associated protein FlgL